MESINQPEIASYAPGACNIGPAEINRRRNFGWVMLVVSVVLAVILLVAGVNPWLRLLVFIPATSSASGFLQAYFHFCSGFASQGVYNFGDLGQTQIVADVAAKKLDRQRGLKITLYAAGIGLIVAILAVVI